MLKIILEKNILVCPNLANLDYWSAANLIIFLRKMQRKKFLPLQMRLNLFFAHASNEIELAGTFLQESKNFWIFNCSLNQAQW